MADQPNLYSSTDNQDILNNIQNLQNMEKDLFNSLESTPNLTQDQKTSILNKINQLSQIRISLYNTLNSMSGFYENTLATTNNTLLEQTAAIKIIEDELNNTKQQTDTLNDEKNNKIRLIEINRYYGERYSDHAAIMKIIVLMMLPIVILFMLNKRGIINNMIFLGLTIIIAIIGSIFLWKRMFSLMMRNNMEYDTFDWPFNQANAPAVPSDTNRGLVVDPWATPNIPCIGTGTGLTGTTTGLTGTTTGLTGTTTGLTGTTTSVTGTSESFKTISDSAITESMVNNIFTKYARQKNRKPHVTLGSEYIKSYNSY